jgi:hypothetical protein
METQMIDVGWAQTKPLPEAILDLQCALAVGTARRFVVGTNEAVEKEKSVIA